MNNKRSSYINSGVTEVLDVFVKKELLEIQNLIYEQTKYLLINHNNKMRIEEKIKLPFKKIPPKSEWTKLMNVVNESKVLKNLIKSEGVIKIFKKIFVNNPKFFFISKFRANFPSHERSTYDWHQDHGTWYMSKEINIKEIEPATMWFSINGADKSNSIEIIKESHKNGLLDHQNIEGQGYFKVRKEINLKKKNIITVKCDPSQCVIFDPLTLHRSIPSKKLKPRYSIDIRYYDENEKREFKINNFFKFKRILKKFERKYRI